MTVMSKSHDDIRAARHRTPPPVGVLSVGALWPKNGVNLGTLARTCDAVNASIIVPAGALATNALRRGNTIGLHHTPVRYTERDPLDVVAWFPGTVVAVELAHGAIPLRDVAPAIGPTMLLVGHETSGIPDDALALCDYVVEIPMAGVGNSLNVTVAASLVLYKLRGWA